MPSEFHRRVRATSSRRPIQRRMMAGPATTPTYGSGHAAEPRAGLRIEPNTVDNIGPNGRSSCFSAENGKLCSSVAGPPTGLLGHPVEVV